MAYRVRFKGMANVNVWRVVIKVIIVLVALWGGGIALDAIGDSIANTTSPFYQGLSIIGYTVGAPVLNASTWYTECGGDGNTSVYQGGTTTATEPDITTCVTDTSGSGILAVVGIFAIIAIVSEFVRVTRN